MCCVVTYLCNKHKNGHRVPPFSRSAEHGDYKEGGSSELMYIRNQQGPASLFNEKSCKQPAKTTVEKTHLAK